MAINQYLIGRNATVIALTGVYADVNGVLTDGYTGDLNNAFVFDSFKCSLDSGLEEITAANASMKNYVPIQGDFTVTLTEIEQNDGYSNIMATFFSSDYFRVMVSVRAPGGSADGGLFAATCVRDTCEKGLVAGKNIVTLTGRPSGIPPYYGLAANYSPSDTTNAFNKAAAGARPLVAHAASYRS